jgi:two-component sensor histidine kinase
MFFRITKVVLLFIGLSILITTNAEAVKIRYIDSINEPLNLTSFLQFFEDDKHAKSADELIVENTLFKPLDQSIPQHWRSSYWAKFEIENCSEKELRLSLFFKNLTNVELFEFKNGEPAGTHLAGLFRSKKEITPGDDHDHFNLKIEKDEHITYLIKVNHSKGYKPRLNFSIQDEKSYHAHKSKIEKFYYLIFGAFLVFFIFLLLTYLFNRYEPYFWLGIFTIGNALYGFNMSGQMLDLFPDYPELLWRMNTLFTALSAIGGFMLISKFFDVKKHEPWLQRIINFSVGIQIFQFVVCQLIIYFFHNYKFMTLFAVYISAIFIPLILIIPVKLWNRLNTPQKMLSTFIFLYAGLLMIGLLLLAILKEDGIVIVTYLNNLSGVAAIGFFTISLGEQMRTIEVERNTILQELNLLRNKQNAILKELVEERTKELQEVNSEVVFQKEALSVRNERIELLLKELHHRVKNNLQIISSFYDLRRDDPSKKDLNVFLDEGKNRINVMAMVHNMLYQGNETVLIDTGYFLNQIAAHLEMLFNINQRIHIQIISPEIKFDMDTALPLGLIFNELLTNTYKHTQSGENKILVKIELTQCDKHSYTLIFSDNGNKIDFEIEPERTKSFGLHMIYLLSKQLNGNFGYKYDGKNNFIVNFMDTEGRRQIP